MQLIHVMLPNYETHNITVNNVSNDGNKATKTKYYVNGLPLPSSNLGTCTHEEKIQHLEHLKGQSLQVVVNTRFIDNIVNIRNANKQDISLCI